MTITLYGDPRTKKNSLRKFGKVVLPSEQFLRYQEDCICQIHSPKKPIDYAVNVKCLYYMQTRRTVDLTNLLSATDDILVKAGVLLDDNCRIIASHDGSRVLYDKDNPRAEIIITEAEA